MEIWNPINRDNRLRMMKANEERKMEVPMNLRKMGDTQMVLTALIITVTFAANLPSLDDIRRTMAIQYYREIQLL